MKLTTRTGLVLITIAFAYFTSGGKTNGQSSTSVNASIKIGICGNGTVEKGEDCDGTNLNNKTCNTLGYGGGTLSCDISCSYTTSACIPATPTLTPTIVPTIVPSVDTPVIAQTTTPTPVTPSDTPTPTPTEVQTSTSQQTIIIPQIKKKDLPSSLKAFDFNGDDKINKQDLPEVVSLWVDSWKQYLAFDIKHDDKAKNIVCDINHNGSCNLDDFSILMYYVER